MKGKVAVRLCVFVILVGGFVSQASAQFVYLAREGLIDDLTSLPNQPNIVVKGGAIWKFDVNGNKIDSFTSTIYGGQQAMALGSDGRIYVRAHGKIGEEAFVKSVLLSYDPNNLSDERVVVDDIPTLLGGNGGGPMGVTSDGKLIMTDFGATNAFGYKLELNGTLIDPVPFITQPLGMFADPVLSNPYPLQKIQSRNGQLFIGSGGLDAVLVYNEDNGTFISGAEEGIDEAAPGTVTSPLFGPDLNNDGMEDLYKLQFLNGVATNTIRVISGKEIFDGTYPGAQPTVLSTDYTNNLNDAFTGTDDLLNGASGDMEFLPDGTLLVGILPNQQSGATNDLFCGLRQYDPDTLNASVFHDFNCLQQNINGTLTNGYFGNPQVILFIAASTSFNPADFTMDGKVDPADFAILTGNWLQPGGPTSGDANGDGFVDPGDFAILTGNWLLGTGGLSAGLGAVPEPSTILLALLGAMAVVGYALRRRAA